MGEMGITVHFPLSRIPGIHPQPDPIAGILP